jgi:hypothetical protein
VSHHATEKELITWVEKLTTELNSVNEPTSRLFEMEHERNTQLSAELQLARENTNQLQAHVEWLQNEWDAAKRRVEELSQRVGRLESDTEWLQREWEAAKAKIEELNQSSHHWWTMADQLKRELQSVYASKSWRITWPLRKTMQAIKWVGASPMLTVQSALRLPKRIVKPTIVWTMRKALANPFLKSHALDILANYPRLKQYLRQFAIRSGLMDGWHMMSSTSDQLKSGLDLENTGRSAHQTTMTEEFFKNLAPRVERIYFDLKRAIDARKS